MNTKIVRRRGACEHCKRKKIKCDGGLPQCSSCQKQEEVCLYKRSAKVIRGSESHNDARITDLPQPDELFSEYINFDTHSSELPAGCMYAGSLDSALFLDLDFDFSGQVANHSIAASSSWSEAASVLNAELAKQNSLAGLFPPEIQAWASTPQNALGLIENNRTVETFPTFLRIIRQNLKNLAVSENSVPIRGLFEKIFVQLKSSFNQKATLDYGVDPKLAQTSQYSQSAACRYAEAFFSNYHSRYPFLERLLFDDWLEAVVRHGRADEPAQTMIVQVILGIGCKLEGVPLTPALGETFAGSRSYVLSAMGLRSRLIEAPATVSKVQAFLSMAIYYLEIEGDSLMAWSLLSHAVQLALALKLNLQESVLHMATSTEDYYLLQRLFWVLYSIEKPFAIRLGISSMINDDFIDYCPEGWSLSGGRPAGMAPDNLLCYCQYAKVYSKVMKDLYSARAAERQIDHEGARASLVDILHKWRECSGGIVRDLDLKTRYYEVLFTIHQSGENRVYAARELLADAHLFEIPKVSGIHELMQISIWACCILLIDVFSLNKTRDFQKNSAFLSIAGGYFGRLAITSDGDFGFSELIELIWMAQQQCRNAQLCEGTKV